MGQLASISARLANVRSASQKQRKAKISDRQVDRLLHCKVCKQPLAARDGEHILKYSLVVDRARVVRADSSTLAIGGHSWVVE